MNILKKDARWFIVVIDYYSKYIELSQLPQLNTRTVIQRLEVIFARHGIPETVFTDNGTQLTFSEMHKFAEEWDFEIITRSPSCPQANGLAEAAVKIVKRALDTHSPNLAMMLYRATPTSLGHSPAQLLMNRQIRTTIPTVDLSSRIPKKKEVRRKHEKHRAQMEYQFNKAKGAAPLSELTPGTEVYVDDIGGKGIILQKRNEPRSYNIKMDNGTILRRNRKNLRCPKRSSLFDFEVFADKPTDSLASPAPAKPQSPSKMPKPLGSNTTRSGRLVKEPQRYQAVGPLRDRSAPEEET